MPRRLLFLPLLVSAVLSAAAATEIPMLTGRVNDAAGILSASTVSSLGQLLKDHEDSTSNQLVVLTIPGLEGGETIEEFSIRVADAWKIGQKGKDNGVLLVVAFGDRKVRIEVGRGLEGVLPDITCGVIIRHEIIPRFKEQDFDGGVDAGTRAILAALAGAYTADESVETSSGGLSDTAGLLLAGGLFAATVGVFTVIGILTPGGVSWFLYLFLIPFWAAFPMAFFGTTPGLVMLGAFLGGFPLLKLLLPHTALGRRLAARAVASRGARQGGWASFPGSSSWSSGSSSSGSSSSFSGGGGGFSGGGASGSW